MNEASLGGVLQRLAALIGIEVQQLEAVAQSMKTVFGPKALEQDDAPLSIVALWAARRAQRMTELLVEIETRGQAATALRPAPIAQMARDGVFLLARETTDPAPPADYDREHPELHAVRAIANKAPVVAQLRDALVLAEWGGSGSRVMSTCPCCLNGEAPLEHEDGCMVDAALTAAGLPDQPSRDAERARLTGDVNR